MIHPTPDQPQSEVKGTPTKTPPQPGQKTALVDPEERFFGPRADPVEGARDEDKDDN